MGNIKYIIVIAYILLYNMASAQSLVWERTYGDDNWDAYGGDIIQTNDGGYMIGGSGYDPIGYYFIKVDSKGVISWTQHYFSGLINYFCRSVIQLPDGGYVAMGTGGDDPQCFEVHLLKMDSLGDTTWHKSYGCYDDGRSLITVQDGGYLLTGRKKTDKGYRAYLLKLDSLGNKQWENVYGGPFYSYGATVIPTDDGNYILTGYNKITSQNYDYGVFISKVKPNGDSIWSKTINGKGYTSGQSIIEALDGGFMIAGSTDSIGNKGGYLIKTDQNGNLKWERTYGKTKVDYFGSMVPSDDGAYIICGSKGLDNGPPSWDFRVGDISLSKIDSNGNVLWDRYYGGNRRDAGGILRKTKGGGYILLGNTFSFGNRERIYLAKLDSAFNVFGVGINNKQVNNYSRFNIFPNPATNVFTIQYNTLQKDELNIYNILGELVYKDSWLQNQTQKNIDASIFPQGIYIIRLGELAQKLIKE